MISIAVSVHTVDYQSRNKENKTMEGIKIRNLHADEIECRVGSVSDWGISLLLYKNARVDQAILDEAFGIYGWQRTHTMIGNSLYCTVSIWDEEKQNWISKQDVGTTGEFEKEKSVASDSFKRACVNIGIGRELYTAPSIYIPANKVTIVERDRKKVVKDSFSVKSIFISEEKVITGLSIMNQKKEEVFRFGKFFENVLEADESEWKELYQELERTGIPEEMLLKRYRVSSLEEMDKITRKRAINGLKKTKSVA